MLGIFTKAKVIRVVNDSFCYDFLTAINPQYQSSKKFAEIDVVDGVSAFKTLEIWFEYSGRPIW